MGAVAKSGEYDSLYNTLLSYHRKAMNAYQVALSAAIEKSNALSHEQLQNVIRPEYLIAQKMVAKFKAKQVVKLSTQSWTIAAANKHYDKLVKYDEVAQEFIMIPVDLALVQAYMVLKEGGGNCSIELDMAESCKKFSEEFMPIATKLCEKAQEVHFFYQRSLEVAALIAEAQGKISEVGILLNLARQALISKKQPIVCRLATSKEKDKFDYKGFCLRELSKIPGLKKERIQRLAAHIDNADENEAKNKLGVILFFCNLNPDYLSDSSVDFLQLKVRCAESIKAATDGLKQKLTAVDQSSVYKRDAFRAVYLPRLLAELLLTQQGSINYWISYKLAKAFVGRHDELLPQDRAVVTGLKLLRENSALRELIQNVRVPQRDNLPGRALIRAALALNPDEIITTQHCQLFLISQLLSHCRQSDTPTCFVACATVKIKDEYPEIFIEHLIELVEKGHIRLGTSEDYSEHGFLPQMHHSICEELLTVDADGVIQDAKHASVYLWEDSSLQLAAKGMGLENIEAYFKPDDTEPLGPKTLRLKEWVLLLAKKAFPNNSAEKCAIGLYYLEAGCRPAGIDAWQYALAVTVNDSQDKLVSNLCAFLQKHALFQTISAQEKAEFMRNFERQLRKSTRFLLDVNCQGPKTTKEILHDISNPMLKRIDTPEKFIRFLCRVVMDIAHDPDTAEKIETMTYIIAEMGKRQFLSDFLKEFYLAKDSIHSLEKEESSFVPWEAKKRGHPDNILAKVLTHYKSEEKTLLADDPDTFVKNFMVYLGIQKTFVKRNNALPRLLLTSPNHGFSTCVAHPTLKELPLREEPILEWIEQRISKPGHEIADSAVGGELANKCIDFMSTNFRGSEEADSERVEFLAKAKNILTHCAIKEYLHELVKLSLRYPCIQNFGEELISFRLTEYAMDRGLDEDRKARWKSTLVHIADTTWSRNSKDLHLMTAINLYTGKLDLFLTDENGGGAKLYNDKTFKKAWQLYLETHSQNHVSIGKGQSFEL